jgi:hypothetical protein
VSTLVRLGTLQLVSSGAQVFQSGSHMRLLGDRSTGEESCHDERDDRRDS